MGAALGEGGKEEGEGCGVRVNLDDLHLAEAGHVPLFLMPGRPKSVPCLPQPPRQSQRLGCVVTT